MASKIKLIRGIANATTHLKEKLSRQYFALWGSFMFATDIKTANGNDRLVGAVGKKADFLYDLTPFWRNFRLVEL